MKILLAICVLLASLGASQATGTAHAEEGWSAGMWDCPDARIQLRKYAVHTYEIIISAPISQVNPIRTNIRANIKELRDGTVVLNGKPCSPVKEEELRENMPLPRPRPTASKNSGWYILLEPWHLK
jgi:hypothetical protein